MLRGLLAVGILLGPAAAIAADLPLRPGFYMLDDDSCEDASMASVLHVMRGSFELGKDICAIAKVTPKGESLSVALRCEDRSIGKKTTQTTTVRILDRETFVFGTAGTDRYRYCPLTAMPDVWQGASELKPFYPAYKPD